VPPLEKRRRKRRRRKRAKYSTEEWLGKIASVERRWKEGAYGKKISKEADELFSNVPTSVTDCFLSSSKYMIRFKKNNRRDKWTSME
jgi:uncharacterized protein YggL (DUF469 family)